MAASDELTERSLQVLHLFEELSRDKLDLHTILELVGGNDPAEREAILEIVEGLVAQKMLAEEGNDYYALTELGARVTTLQDEARVRAPIPAIEYHRHILRLAFYAVVVTLIIFFIIAYSNS